ncbi:MAG: hypothetical protein HYZ37_03825 [Candidatus Solibacter usitatus]|nr:hypothetical protein [Candidatus Solibacter usitatus]
MFTFNKRSLALLLVAALPAAAQSLLNPRSTMHITLPEDSPLAVVSANWGESAATPRGGALLLDLRTSLSLRNVTNHRIRGVTLLVLAQETAPGGKASVSVPSLDVGPGEGFPVKLDVRLLRPQMNADGPLVEISLDGVLYDDLTFYGPNKLNSRRSMTMWELEARRDRKYLRGLFDSAGVEGLRKHLTDVQARLSESPKVDVQMARGRTTAQEPEHTVKFAFLNMPGEPVRAITGWALVTQSEARAPRIDVENSSNRAVRYLEIGWIMTDRSGEPFYAGAVPAEMSLLPGAKGRIAPEASLKLSKRNGQPLPISGMTGFVNHVEFADGSVWIPQREALETPQLKKALSPSPEQQRLSDLYRRKGMVAVVEELHKH